MLTIANVIRKFMDELQRRDGNIWKKALKETSKLSPIKSINSAKVIGQWCHKVSVIFFNMWHQEVGVTKIRGHQIKNSRIWKNIPSYDNNALFLSTMLNKMPSGEGRVVHYTKGNDSARCSFAEVVIEIPRGLFPKYEEMCPFFVKKTGYWLRIFGRGPPCVARLCRKTCRTICT